MHFRYRMLMAVITNSELFEAFTNQPLTRIAGIYFENLDDLIFRDIGNLLIILTLRRQKKKKKYSNFMYKKLTFGVIVSIV